jgi:hypothetical protein
MLLIPGSDTEEAGEVTLRFKWNVALAGASSDATGALSPAEEVIPSDEPEEGDDGDPNELHISVLGAKDLIAMDSSAFGMGTKSSDPRVRIEVGSGGKFLKEKTETREKSLNPVWNEKVRSTPTGPYLPRPPHPSAPPPLLSQSARSLAPLARSSRWTSPTRRRASRCWWRTWTSAA